MNAKKIIPILSISAVALLLGAFLFLGDERSTSSRGYAPDNFEVSDAADPDSEKILDFLEYKLQPGKAYVHKFRRTLNISMNEKAMLDMYLEGHITLHVVSASSGGMSTVFEVNFEKIQGLEGRKGARGERLKIGDTYLVFLRIDRRGGARALRFERKVSPTIQMMVRDIIANYLQPLPRPGSPALKPREKSFLGSIFGDAFTEYKVGGEDTQGKYSARLGLQGSVAAPVRFTQKKVRYVRSSAPVEIKSSRREGRWDLERGFLSRVEGADAYRVSGGGVRVDSGQAYSYEFREMRKARFGPGDAARFTLATAVYDDRPLKTAKAIAANQKPAKSWMELSAMLDNLKPGADLRTRHKTFRALSYSMRKNPGLAAPAVSRARGYDSNDPRFQMIVGALSYSGAPKAQDGLTEIYAGDSLDASGKQNVLAAFTLMDKGLTPKAMKLLVRVFNNADDPVERNSAGLALGSALKNAQNETAYNMIMRSWREADTNERRAVVLQFMGNSGDARFFPIIREMEAGKSPLLRRKAVYALRFMDTDEANAFLLQYLQSKKKTELRLIAVRALSMHGFRREFLPPLRNCVTGEQFVALRIACADIVLEQPPHEAEMRNILAGIRAKDEKLSSDFKDYIEQQLSGRE